MSDIQDAVRNRYGAIAEAIIGSSEGACCGPATCGCPDPLPLTLYSDAERSSLPAEAVAASLGCGNPTALIELQPGQMVLDLGSGGGIDVFLAARRVGPRGRVYGLDMTDAMLALARENQRRAGATNVEFLKGTIEAVPLPDGSMDVVISNCVINLSIDKDSVLREAYRVLKPGGQLAVSDVLAGDDARTGADCGVESWVACLAGALSEDEYRTKLHAAGFEDIQVERWAPGSALVRARKPEPRTCCGPSCCR